MSAEIWSRSLGEARHWLEVFIGDENARAQLGLITEEVVSCYRSGGKILVAGNGGSLTDASHFAEELTGKFRGDRRALGAIALADSAHITCVSNDYGFEFIFSRAVEGLGARGDLLFVLSTSGNSTNLVHAANAAREREMKIIGFLGKTGGKLRSLCDFAVLAPGETSDRIQEIHMLCLHILIEAIEVELGLA